MLELVVYVLFLSLYLDFGSDEMFVLRGSKVQRSDLALDL